MKQPARCKNRVRAALVESNTAFERLVDLSRARRPDVLERIGGPWQALGAGRKRLAKVAGGATAEGPGALWESPSQATGPTDGQVGAEARIFPMLARWARALEADAEALSDLVAAEVAGDETYRCLLTVPGVGKATAAQLVASVQAASFPSHDKLAGHCGLTPKDTQSGTTVSSSSASPEGNRRLKNPPMFTCLSPTGSENEFGRHCPPAGRGACATPRRSRRPPERGRRRPAQSCATRGRTPPHSRGFHKGRYPEPPRGPGVACAKPPASMQRARCFILPDH